jgi:hypothetical protein
MTTGATTPPSVVVASTAAHDEHSVGVRLTRDRGQRAERHGGCNRRRRQGERKQSCADQNGMLHVASPLLSAMLSREAAQTTDSENTQALAADFTHGECVGRPAAAILADHWRSSRATGFVQDVLLSRSTSSAQKSAADLARQTSSSAGSSSPTRSLIIGGLCEKRGADDDQKGADQDGRENELVTGFSKADLRTSERILVAVSER